MTNRSSCAQGAPLLELSHVSQLFSSREGTSIEALRDISIDVDEGEFVTIVGPSGSGKTTLLRIIAGLLQPTGGEIYLRGQRIVGPSSEFGIVFQAPVLFPWRTVLNNVLMPAKILRLDGPASERRALDLLALLGLTGVEKKYPYELSGGMQQRVAIARALVHNPTSLLMDEPFGALDAMTREHLNIELLRVWHESRKTILFITHSIPEAVFLGTKVLVLSARPGRAEGVVRIDLPYPRDIGILSSDQLGRYVTEVRALMTAGERHGAAEAAKPPAAL
jgi:NitT/TauT family transport system ATP-binding protein